MKKVIKVLVILASVMFFIGLVLVLGVLATHKWDFTMFNNRKNVEETFTFEDEIRGISVDATAMSIRIYPTDEDVCRVDATYLEDGDLDVDVNDGILEINYEFRQSWVEFNVGFASEHADIFLPEAVYESLIVDTSAGGVTVAEGVTFVTCDIDTSAGKVEYLGEVTNSISIDTSAGSLVLTDINCDTVDVNTSAGSITLNNVAVEGILKAETSAGSITLHGCSGRMDLETSAGSIHGTVVGEYDFDTDVNVGSCDVPDSVAGAPVISITTNAGSVDIECE